MEWNNDLEKEFQGIKEIMKDSIKISPFDGTKRARVVIDGTSSLGVGFALFQLRDPADEDFKLGVNIIAANSSLLANDQGISPIDGEMQALLSACHCTCSLCPDTGVFKPKKCWSWFDENTRARWGEIYENSPSFIPNQIFPRVELQKLLSRAADTICSYDSLYWTPSLTPAGKLLLLSPDRCS